MWQTQNDNTLHRVIFVSVILQTVLNLPRHSCVFREIILAIKISQVLDLPTDHEGDLPTDHEGERGKKKTGANISLCTVYQVIN